MFKLAAEGTPDPEAWTRSRLVGHHLGVGVALGPPVGLLYAVAAGLTLGMGSTDSSGTAWGLVLVAGPAFGLLAGLFWGLLAGLIAALTSPGATGSRAAWTRTASLTGLGLLVAATMLGAGSYAGRLLILCPGIIAAAVAAALGWRRAQAFPPA